MNIIALNFVKLKESCTFVAYQDSGGVWTLGYGHTKGVKEGDTCTQAQADAWLVEDMQEAVDEVRRLVRVSLSEKQEAALISFEFNDGGLARATMLTYVNNRQWIAAAHEFPKWDHVGSMELKGLLIRRFEEATLFLQGS